MAFVRWNQTTNIWEIAATPENPSTAWNHLPIANPTLPSDTANKAYVDSLVGGGGFVPYTGATADVNLGTHRLIATSIIAKANVLAGGPTLGSSPNYAQKWIDPSVNYGLTLGISTYGDTWFQSQRFDGTTAVYNILLQPAGGKVNIGLGDSSVFTPYALLNIGAGGDIWTTSGWTRAIQVSNVSAIKWAKGTNIAWGIGTSGDLLYFITSTAENNSAAAVYPVRFDGSGNIITTGGIIERSRANFMGSWTAYTPQWKSYTGSDGVIGNGLLAGRYSVVGTTVTFTIQLQVGSTTTFPTNYWAFTLPLPAASIDITCNVFLYRVAGNYIQAVGVAGSYFFGIANTVAIISGTPSSPNGGFVAYNYPWTWVTNDQLFITGQYETT
jgi:hypothetical protein